MKPKLIFKKSKKMDYLNVYYAINRLSYGHDFTKILPEELIKKVKGRNFDDVKKEIKKVVDKEYKKIDNKIYPHLKNVEKEWKKVEIKYFERLETVMKRKFLANEVIVYATMLGKCDYMYKLPKPWFKVSILRNKEFCVLTMMHEMVHFMFHWHYLNYCEEKIGKELTSDLKETITFLLNEEFSDLLKVKDPGYEMHKELREELIKVWRETKNFERFLDKSFPIVKKWGEK